MEHYRNSEQYTQLRDAFEKFDALINTNLIQDNPAQMNAEPLIQKLFNEDTMGESGNNRKNGQSKEDKINYTTFYELISDDFWVIDLRTLETINDILEKGNGETIESMITKDTSGLSKNFINKYQQNIVAENFLEENSSARDTPTA